MKPETAAALHAENAALRERCRTTAQLLIDAVGAEGPTDCDEAARRAVAVIAKLRAALEAAPDTKPSDVIAEFIHKWRAWIKIRDEALK